LTDIPKEILRGEAVTLRPLTVSDFSDQYLGWMNDPEINRYLETQWEEQTRDTIEIFLEEMEKSENSVLFGIFHDGKHVGNIKIGPVNWHHLYADVSYFIGDRSVWGQGLATEAVLLVSRFGFEQLGLNKCKAGSYSGNTGSMRVLEKVGYRKEGCLKDELLGPNGREDHILYGLNKNFFFKSYD
jgi:RimJ/RimL family protein N-acetyltransferase